MENSLHDIVNVLSDKILRNIRNERQKSAQANGRVSVWIESKIVCWSECNDNFLYWWPYSIITFAHFISKLERYSNFWTFHHRALTVITAFHRTKMKMKKKHFVLASPERIRWPNEKKAIRKIWIIIMFIICNKADINTLANISFRGR